MAASEKELSIVMPCLNEEAALPFCLDRAFGFLAANRIDGEVIVADNGSSDGSVNIAAARGAVIIKEIEKGYGSAIRAGVEHAQGRYIVIGDADGSYDFDALLPFLQLLKAGNDLVIGNRFRGGIRKNAMPFLHRYLGNPVLSFLGRIFFRLPVSDFHCGLRAIEKDQFRKLDLRTTGMEFASEMIVKAGLCGLTIAETPVILYPDQRGRPSHLKTWRDGWRHLRFLLLYSPKWLFLIPGILLMVLGFTGTVALISGPISVGNKTLDVHTLVYTSAFVVLGFQFVAFYVFSRLYAAVNGLWPAQEKFIRSFRRWFHLEKGILAGLLLLAAGFFLMIKSLLYWSHTHFGNLDPLVVLRWVVPSAALMILGVQLIVSFFYLSFLTIKSRVSP